MSLIEIIIIYLTCGAPFGVYYFYQKREYSNSPRFWLSSFLAMIFWIPYSIRLLHTFVNKKLINHEFAEKSISDSIIDNFEKKFTQLLLEEKIDISLFEFRETFERYVGLTNEIFVSSSESEAELYQITNHENKLLATKLLNRHNRLRLNEHQTIARKDFLRMIIKIDSSISEKEKVRTLAKDFVKLIKDVEAQSELHKIFQNSTQSGYGFPVNEMEKEVWNPIETKQLHLPKKALNFRTISATATTSKPD